MLKSSYKNSIKMEEQNEIFIINNYLANFMGNFNLQ